MSCVKKVLANGMRILAVPMPGSRTVTVLVLVEAGSKYESKEINGISHFLEHMCFKGTTSRPNNSAIATELDGLGCDFNAFTGEEFTGYYAKGVVSHFDHILDIISDLYLNPLFESEEIKKEKGVIVDEINMYDDTPSSKVQEVWMKLLFGDQPAGWTITGEREVVRGMKREDFIAYRAQRYVASATTVVITGNIDPSKVIKQVAEKFSSISTNERDLIRGTIDCQSGPQSTTLYKKTSQTNFRLGFRTVGNGDEREVALDILAGVLGEGMSSRLFHKIRDEMGLGYLVSAASDQYTGHGHLVVSVGVANDRVEEVIKAILVEFRDLRDNLVGENELQKVKERLVGTLYLEIESSDDLALYYGTSEILHLNLRTPEEQEQQIRAVTANELQELAREFFVEKNLNLALVGPFRDSRPFKELLKL